MSLMCSRKLPFLHFVCEIAQTFSTRFQGDAPLVPVLPVFGKFNALLSNVKRCFIKNSSIPFCGKDIEVNFDDQETWKSIT